MRVSILGTGLSSLTLAKALVNQKIFVDLIFSKKTNKLNHSRTIGISKSNVEFFNNQIINIEKIIWKLKKIEIFTDNFKKEKLLNFENKDEHLFSIVKNYQLYEILKKSLNKNKYFNEVNLKKEFVSFDNYDLVINCNYSNSITKKFFSKKVKKKYNSFAYTTIIKHEKISNNVATQVFTKRGPLAFLPISNNETSIVYSLRSSKDLKNEEILNLINKYNFKYKINKIGKMERFELESFSLRHYYHKNILAFGDLLHRIHPLAGQGFNMTIRDINFLIGIILDKIELGLPLDSSVCKEFEKKIRHKNFIFSNGIDFVHEFFTLESKLNNKIFGNTLKYLGQNNSINKFFVNVADKGLVF